MNRNIALLSVFVLFIGFQSLSRAQERTVSDINEDIAVLEYWQNTLSNERARLQNAWEDPGILVVYSPASASWRSFSRDQAEEILESVIASAKLSNENLIYQVTDRLGLPRILVETALSTPGAKAPAVLDFYQSSLTAQVEADIGETDLLIGELEEEIIRLNQEKQALLAPGPAAVQCDLSGSWNGNDWGDINLNQSSTGYSGTYTSTYEDDTGDITINITTLEGTWGETNRKGELFDIVISEDGCSISGSWNVTSDDDLGPAVEQASFNWTKN
ncbi:MAG: hypothetical protein KC422_17055 [Trueperaceae bacterium]|nr:hypothetical protein [Trueperaceae bacterium]